MTGTQCGPAHENIHSSEEDWGERRSFTSLTRMAGESNGSLKTETSVSKEITSKSHAWYFTLENEIIKTYGKEYMLHLTKYGL